MKISFFKTYKTNHNNSLTTKKIQEFEFQVPRALSHSKKKQKSDELKVGFNSDLIKMLDKNRSKLLKKDNFSNPQIQKRLQALLGNNHSLKSSKIHKTLDKIPLKKYSSLDTELLQDHELKLLKYVGNHKDPYGKIRNFNNISFLK
ncbi:MAG: hypothetical protein COB02_08500 [Candidatus Cloacimonadota bacterium]|nr:MAG: hypothetical protein COB02_08500 [Candidatus Cloacimonadota bacterium]